MKIALVQHAAPRDVGEGLARALDAIDAAAMAGARLVAFPELQLGTFFPQHSGLDVSARLQGLDGEVANALSAAARSHGVVLVPNFYLGETGGCFDASPVYDSDGALRGVAKMVHVVDAPGFHEQDYYTPSAEGFRTFDTGVGRVGVVVCFDRHYPESIRRCALDGAWLVVIPTANTTAEPLELFEWEMRVAAYQSGLYVALCNRVGQEDVLTFAGLSLVAGPNGECVARAGAGEELLLAEIDPDRVVEARRERPYLALRDEGACRL